jgi:hypothetical protein
MVSFDVSNLFTNIPLRETIDIAVNKILENNPGFKISKTQLKKLFMFATSQTHFLFNGNIYDQIDGVAMGSPLGPVLANLFMGVHETTWLETYTGLGPLFYRRYVDDIFCVFNNVADVSPFLEFLNSRHPNIKFTVEYEVNGKLPFLDTLVDSSQGETFYTSIFRKKTFTGLLTNLSSYCSFSYKVGLVRTLLHRIYNINNSWSGFHTDVENITNILTKNQFPEHLTSKCIKSFLHTKIASSDKPVEANVKDCSVRYFKLPYVGFASKLTHDKLHRLINTYCKGISVKLVFTSLKVGSFFCTKDNFPKGLRSGVIYKFNCAGCNASYIGETSRHFNTRIEDHLGKDRASHVWKHLKDSKCKQSCTADCFSVLDYAATDFQRKLKEAMHIQWHKPNLNSQIHHVSLSLSL